MVCATDELYCHNIVRFILCLCRIVVMIRGRATTEGTQQFAERSGADVANYRHFADLTLSNVGMGTYLGDTTVADDKAVEQAIRDSVMAGMNVFDTAINYRSQKAERSLGRAISDLVREGVVSRDCIFLSTKGGYVTADADIPSEFWEYVKDTLIKDGTIKAGDISSQYHCMSLPFLEDQLGRSLRNLDVECIDLMYLHNVMEGQSADVPHDELLGRLGDAIRWLESKRKAGLVQYYGLATWECFRVPPDHPQYLSLDDVLEMAVAAGGTSHGMRFVQLPYNMYMDQALRKPTQPLDGLTVPFLEAAIARNIGVFTSVPFMQGRLLQPGVLPKFLEGPASVRSLQFLRSTPGVLAPLVGHKSRPHVSENLSIMRIPPLKRDQFNALLDQLLH